MNRDAIFTEIADYLVVSFEVPRELITQDAHLVDTLNLDSIDAVDMMVKLQEISGRKVSPEEFARVRTVSDVIDLALK